MERLKYSFSYLCGPIDHADDCGTTWRDNITPALKCMGIVVLDPTKKPIKTAELGMTGETKKDVENIKRLKVVDKPKAVKIMKGVRGFDLRLVDKSDFLIVNYDTDIRMCGSHEEIITANRSKKPILFMSPFGIEEIDNWYWGASPYQMFFDNWTDLLSYVEDIHTGRDTRHFRRWTFLDIEDQIEAIARQPTLKEIP